MLCSHAFLVLRRSAPLEALWWLVEAEWREAPGAQLLPTTFVLAATFPRRVYTRPAPGDEATLASAGLGAQESLFVEKAP